MHGNGYKYVEREGRERERERDIWLAGIDLYFERNGKRSWRSVLIFSRAFICSLFESKRAIRWEEGSRGEEVLETWASSVIRYRKRVIYHSMLSWRSLILLGPPRPFRDRGRWKSRRISLKKVDGWTSWALAVEEKQKNIGRSWRRKDGPSKWDGKRVKLWNTKYLYPLTRIFC